VSVDAVELRRYFAYGLELRSEFELPGLLGPESGDLGGPPAAVVSIRRGSVDGLPGVPEGKLRLYAATPTEIRIRYREVCAILVREGREILVDPEAGAGESAVSQVIIGPALAALLHQREYLVLHASAVARDGQATAFLAASGQGKSTTAAVLHKRGYRLVADDVLPVFLRDGQPLVWPGPPRLKLWPESLALLGEDPASLRRVNHWDEKRFRGASGSPERLPVPLTRVYVLDRGQETRIDPLRTGDALVELLRHSYVSKFMLFLKDTGKAADHLVQCSRLIEAVGVFRLSRELRAETLDGVADLVEREAVRPL
jgi:hypothetical protein